MENIKYFIGKDANSMYEALGTKRNRDLENLAYNTKDEIFEYFSAIKTSSKIDYIPMLQYWLDTLNTEGIQQKLNLGMIDKIHFDFTGVLKKNVTNISKLVSNTKVLCSGDGFKISVEGKSKDFRKTDEPQKFVYPTIREMKSGREPIIKGILDLWIGAIQDFCQPNLARIEDLQYQFLLRLVDACNNNTGRAIVLHQFFYENESTLINEWIENLRIWKSIINPNERLSFFAQKIQIAPIDASVSTEELLQKVKTDRAVAFEKDEIIEI